MLDFTKYNPQSFAYQTELEENQYLASFSLIDQCANNVKSNDMNNNAVAIIEGLFLNIRYRSSYKRLIEKIVHETWKFLIHSTRHISSRDWMALDGIRLGLRPFQALGIFLMLQIKVDTGSKGIIVDKIRYRKERYLIF